MINLKVLHSPYSKYRWIAWGKNVTERTMCGYVTLDNNGNVARPFFSSLNNFIRDQSHVDELDRCGLTYIEKEETIRKPTLKEYIKIGEYLKKNKIIYNKKKDNFQYIGKGVTFV